MDISVDQVKEILSQANANITDNQLDILATHVHKVLVLQNFKLFQSLTRHVLGEVSATLKEKDEMIEDLQKSLCLHH